MYRVAPERVADVGRALRAFFDGKASRWTQGATAKDVEGNPVPSAHERAVCWCLEGAVLHLDIQEGAAAVYQALGNTISVAKWNDDPERSFRDVEELLAVMVAGGAR